MKKTAMMMAAGLVLAAGSAFAAEDEAMQEGGQQAGDSFFDKSVTWLSTDTYVGLSFGTASPDTSEAELAASLTTATLTGVSIDDGDTGYRVFVGKQFMPHLAVELGYADLGEIDVNVDGDALDVPAFLQQLADNVPVAPSGITIDAVSEWTFADFNMEGDWAEKLSVHGRLGVFMWETEVSYTDAGVTYSNDDDGTDIRFGVGAGWKFNENFSARFDYEMYSATTDVDMISLGAVYSF